MIFLGISFSHIKINKKRKSKKYNGNYCGVMQGLSRHLWKYMGHDKRVACFNWIQIFIISFFSIQTKTKKTLHNFRDLKGNLEWITCGCSFSHIHKLSCIHISYHWDLPSILDGGWMSSRSQLPVPILCWRQTNLKSTVPLSLFSYNNELHINVCISTNSIVKFNHF